MAPFIPVDNASLRHQYERDPPVAPPSPPTIWPLSKSSLRVKTREWHKRVVIPNYETDSITECESRFHLLTATTVDKRNMEFVRIVKKMLDEKYLKNRYALHFLYDVIIDCEATNMHGFRTPEVRIVMRLFANDIVVWTVCTTCNDGMPLIRAYSLEVAWSKFLTAFGERVKCDLCARPYTGDSCIECIAHTAMTPLRECLICTLKRNDLYRLRCGHSNYCRPCLKRTAPHKCPLCRAPYRVNRGYSERKRYRDEGEEEEDDMDDGMDSGDDF